MRRFKSTPQAQRFLRVHAAVYSLFNLQRHLTSAALLRLRRARAFELPVAALLTNSPPAR